MTTGLTILAVLGGLLIRLTVGYVSARARRDPAFRWRADLVGYGLGLLAATGWLGREVLHGDLSITSRWLVGLPAAGFLAFCWWLIVLAWRRG